MRTHTLGLFAAAVFTLGAIFAVPSQAQDTQGQTMSPSAPAGKSATTTHRTRHQTAKRASTRKHVAHRAAKRSHASAKRSSHRGMAMSSRSDQDAHERAQTRRLNEQQLQR